VFGGRWRGVKVEVDDEDGEARRGHSGEGGAWAGNDQARDKQLETLSAETEAPKGAKVGESWRSLDLSGRSDWMCALCSEEAWKLTCSP
jgi:hypothetical protein